MAEASDQSPAALITYEQLENYSWDSDEDFQSGLDAILGANPSSEQAAELTLRARCFYYARKFNRDIDFDGYKAWRQQNLDLANGTNESEIPSTQNAQAPTVSTGQEQSAPYPASFAQVVELISSGQPIPGIKEIPDTVLTGQETESSTAKRKKPWERDPD
ncbi:hypothetical protein EV356DRAFT_529427 [Viridothelium virens]|uniref:Uncharacterized protein n=1 Tax=Viridothelium virens TaxID=1048519 RepID=A0A6A6HLV2_VIRVR|nr:hypothetical protein EV356DRAFT_529427 [Viridothelium virens]